jgi:hypothetical protein
VSEEWYLAHGGAKEPQYVCPHCKARLGPPWPFPTCGACGGSLRRCIVVVQGRACGKPATHVIFFKDGDRAPACHTCALDMEQKIGARFAPLEKAKIS